MLKTLEFENFGDFKKFSMAEGSEFKRFTVLGGMPDIIAFFLQYVKKYFFKKQGIARISHAIENGSHYTEFQDRVKGCLSILQRHHQLITYTQSYEMLQAIVLALENDKEAQDNFAYVRLIRQKQEGRVRGISYTYENLRDDLSINWEVR